MLPSPTWSFVSTPPDLTLTASGSAFSGTAPYSVVATATEGGNSVSAAAFSVTVTPAINIAGGPSGAIAGVVGNALPATSAPTVSDAIGTLSLALLENGTPVTLASLCAGLSFDTTDGVVSGIPTAACSLGNLTIQATDNADGSTAMTSPAFALSVAGDTATASPTSPATVRSGAPIAGTLSTNLASPVWSLVSTPAGLTLTASGSSFSGTAPSVASPTTYSVTATATHGSFSQSAAAFSLTVIPPLAVSAGPSGTLSGTVGTAFSASTAPTVANLIGTAIYGLLESGSAVTLSSVCPGLTFNISGTNAGQITGTPTATCSTGTTLTIQVTDGFDSTTAKTSTPFGITVTTPVSNAHGWGGNASGQIGDGTTTNRLTPVSVNGGKTYTQLSAGANYACGLVSDGTIQCWGDNSSGQLGNGTTTASDIPVTVPGITGATAVSTGSHVCAIVSGAAKCWGDNTFGQVGDGTTTKRLTPTQVSGLTSGSPRSAPAI
jgi:hypothetical protein